MHGISQKELADLLNQTIAEKGDVKKAAASFSQKTYKIFSDEAEQLRKEIASAANVMENLYENRKRELKLAEQIANFLDGAFGDVVNHTFTDPIAREAFNLYKRTREIGASDDSASKMVYAYLKTHQAPASMPENLQPVPDLKDAADKLKTIKDKAGLNPSGWPIVSSTNWRNTI